MRPRRPFGRGINLQIKVANVTTIEASVRAHGAPLVLPMEERWYRVNEQETGNRQFVVADPDGYLLRFFEDLGLRPLREEGWADDSFVREPTNFPSEPGAGTTSLSIFTLHVRPINRIVLVQDEENSMPKAVGIGGVFFRAANPAGLAEWYQKHLGIDDLHKSVWQQEAGMTIFGPFSKDTDYFGRAEQQWMVNFRVDDLDGLIASLTASGIAVETRNEWNSEIGRFARIHDPEGNPVELWEPAQD